MHISRFSFTIYIFATLRYFWHDAGALQHFGIFLHLTFSKIPNGLYYWINTLSAYFLASLYVMPPRLVEINTTHSAPPPPKHIITPTLMPYSHWCFTLFRYSRMLISSCTWFLLSFSRQPLVTRIIIWAFFLQAGLYFYVPPLSGFRLQTLAA